MMMMMMGRDGWGINKVKKRKGRSSEGDRCAETGPDGP